MDRILLVDDETNVLRALQRVLHLHLANTGVSIETYEDPKRALARAAEVPFALVMSDYRMPGLDGVAFLKRFKAIQPQAARLILSAQADQEALIGAINEAQILRFLAKPWNDLELVQAIEQGLDWYTRTTEDERLMDRARLQERRMSPQEFERKRLEKQEPGITRVRWGPNGEVLLESIGESAVSEGNAAAALGTVRSPNEP